MLGWFALILVGFAFIGGNYFSWPPGAVIVPIGFATMILAVDSMTRRS